jgi:hypothetical protein
MIFFKSIFLLFIFLTIISLTVICCKLKEDYKMSKFDNATKYSNHMHIKIEKVEAK